MPSSQPKLLLLAPLLYQHHCPLGIKLLWCHTVNDKFHGREHQINDIRKFFEADSAPLRGQKRMIFQGFPGIGKTTLALQYSVNYCNLYDGVFWLNAHSTEPVDGDDHAGALERDYLRVDNEVKSRTKLSFRDWCSNKKWLLIIENIEDSMHVQALSRIIPQAGEGQVLVTSRRTTSTSSGKSCRYYL
ncbi:P-loop containing nucleoside triphosphate hydrolase protein [Podospora didyma]|uniref:P-loop containing nucleoside triphosphate hydrolase protein n=1 Tax=Podospora didyma TaxID=330526 RepID=A0AAE0NWZ6_9PEZI|nr:P-loop containing nucleoside triphosphate hydrolase protein [Podospora didyma]